MDSTEGSLKEEIRKSLEDAIPVRWALAGGQKNCDAFIAEASVVSEVRPWMGGGGGR